MTRRQASRNKVDDHYVLTADLPGVDPGSVDVNVDNGTMALTAHDCFRISATYENGVLTGAGSSLSGTTFVKSWSSVNAREI